MPPVANKTPSVPKNPFQASICEPFIFLLNTSPNIAVSIPTKVKIVSFAVDFISRVASPTLTICPRPANGCASTSGTVIEDGAELKRKVSSGVVKRIKSAYRMLLVPTSGGIVFKEPPQTL